MLLYTHMLGMKLMSGKLGTWHQSKEVACKKRQWQISIVIWELKRKYIVNTDWLYQLHARNTSECISLY